MDLHAYNRAAWDKQVANGNRWTVPVSSADVQRARQGDWQIVLTPTKPVPPTWFPPLRGTATLCLASGGGQQGPILAAAGADVTVLDASPKQLAQDRLVSQRDGLDVTTVEGDMADLSVFGDATFDLIVHPCSNCFVPQIRPVWRECFRVLRSGGVLLAGFVNPVRYIFDQERLEAGHLEIRHAIPYADLTDMDEATRQRWLLANQEPLEFGHTLDDQLGGQLATGFVLSGFYEDRCDKTESDPLSNYLPTFMATRAVKLSHVTPTNGEAE